MSARQVAEGDEALAYYDLLMSELDARVDLKIELLKSKSKDLRAANEALRRDHPQVARIYDAYRALRSRLES